MSRRGLIAVGLAVAVVGTMGVVSTMNAGAAETPVAPSSVGAPDGAATTDPVKDPAQAPPPLLPWGAKPKPIVEGEPGDSSRELTASGASAVDVAAEPEAGFEPKGESLRRGVLRTSETDVPPRPPIAAEPVNGQSQVDYFYAVGRQSAAPDGVAALLKVSQPAVSTQDWHSLAEIAVQSADAHQVVEVGWIVNSGDNSTHLFVYHWVNGAPTCYNACGFVPYAGASIAPGAALAVDVSKQFGIQHYNGAWWIAYDSEWIVPGLAVERRLHPDRPGAGLRRGGGLEHQPVHPDGQRFDAGRHLGGEDFQRHLRQRPAGGADRQHDLGPLPGRANQRSNLPLRRCRHLLRPVPPPRPGRG